MGRLIKTPTFTKAQVNSLLAAERKKLKPKILTKADIDKIRIEERKKLKAKITTQGEIDKLLVEQRKKSKQSYRQSRFMQRTLMIYNGQKRRATELKRELAYSLDDFRDLVAKQIEGNCPYCPTKLTVNNFVDDHPWSVSRGGPFTLDNTAACCKPCNYRKGNMNKEEFEWFTQAIKNSLPAEVVTDIWRRLALGGKWAGNMFA